MTELLSAELTACPTQLSAEQIARYRRDGFIAFHSVLDDEEVERAKAGLANVVEMLRPGHAEATGAGGTVWSASDSPMRVQFQAGHEPDDANDARAIEKIRKYFQFVGAEPFLTQLAHDHAKIGGVLANLVGRDAILSQDMALMNPPGIGTGKPWHQDDAYFKIAPLDAVCGVWIALDDVGLENGCMNFLPGWHRRGALRHYHGSDCEIFPQRLEGTDEEVVPVPLPRGGAVFFNGIAPHMTKPNASPSYRRALQYHYRARDSRELSDEEYDQIFAEPDGTPASCRAASQRGF